MMGWGYWGNMMGGYGSGFNGNYWWMGLIGMVLQVVFWIAVVVIVYRLISGNNSNHSANNSNRHNDTSLNILRERYAKGEIDTEEYTRRKEGLGH